MFSYRISYKHQSSPNVKEISIQFKALVQPLDPVSHFGAKSEATKMKMASARDEREFELKRRFEENKEKKFTEDVGKIRRYWKRDKRKVSSLWKAFTVDFIHVTKIGLTIFTSKA